MKIIKSAKKFCVIFFLVILNSSVLAEEIAFAFNLPVRPPLQSREQPDVSIGIFLPDRESPSKYYQIYRWKEYASVANTSLVHSLNILLEIGSTNVDLSSLSGTSYDVLFFDSNKDIPRSIASISRGLSWVSIYSCRQDAQNGLVYAERKSNQVNPMWVGLVYGTLVRYNFDAIQRERDIFRIVGGGRSFEDFLFCEPASEAFERDYPSITNNASAVSDEALWIMLTNRNSRTNSKEYP